MVPPLVADPNDLIKSKYPNLHSWEELRNAIQWHIYDILALMWVVVSLPVGLLAVGTRAFKYIWNFIWSKRTWDFRVQVALSALLIGSTLALVDWQYEDMKARGELPQQVDYRFALARFSEERNAINALIESKWVATNVDCLAGNGGDQALCDAYHAVLRTNDTRTLAWLRARPELKDDTNKFQKVIDDCTTALANSSPSPVVFCRQLYRFGDRIINENAVVWFIMMLVVIYQAARLLPLIPTKCPFRPWHLFPAASTLLILYLCYKHGAFSSAPVPDPWHLSTPLVSALYWLRSKCSDNQWTTLVLGVLTVVLAATLYAANKLLGASYCIAIAIVLSLAGLLLVLEWMFPGKGFGFAIFELPKQQPLLVPSP